MKDIITDDRYEGLDSGENVYDPKKELHYQNRIWYFLGVFFTILIISLFVNQMKDLYLENNGQYIEIEYSPGDAVAYGRASDGSYHSYNLAGINPKLYDGKVRFYYMDDIRLARCLNHYSFYLKGYVFFFAALAICIWRIIVNFKNNNKTHDRSYEASL